MKVLLFDNSALILSGNEKYCAEGTGKFASELNELGLDVTMFGQIVNSNNGVAMYNLNAHGIKTNGVIRRNKLFSFFLYCIKALYFIFRSDFCYFFYPTSNQYLIFLCAFLNIPFGLYLRGDAKIKSWLSKFLYKRARCVFTVSDGFTKMVNDISKKKNSFTIKPMIAYDEKDVILNREYSVHKPFRILFLSRVTKAKGVEEVLNAISILRKKYDIVVSIVGDGSYLEPARVISKDLEIDDIVTFYGAITDKHKKRMFYLDSDLYILPTYYPEGFPRTLYEAMIFGTPIITSFVAGIPGLMVDGYNCKRVIEHSVDDLVSSICFAIDNYEDMVNCAQNATNLVLPIIDSKRKSHACDVYQIITNRF